MALPELTPPPAVPERTQAPATFNTNTAAFLNWMATLRGELDAWGDQLPVEFADQLAAVDQAIADAVAAYDPEGQYSAAQVDALLANYYTATQVDDLIAAQEARISADSYFFNVTA